MDSAHVQCRTCSFPAFGGHSVRFLNGAATSREVQVKSWVYFARLGDDGPIKIGHAINPRRRVAALSSLSPHSITLIAAMPCDDAPVEEKRLHQKLEAARIKGECFRASAVHEEMRLIVARLVSPDVLPAIRASTDGAVEDLFAAVMDKLREVEADAHGKLRASDVFSLVGFERPNRFQKRLISRALRTLGWTRKHRLLNGGLIYARSEETSSVSSNPLGRSPVSSSRLSGLDEGNSASALLAVVRKKLRDSLGDECGKLRKSDALALAGFDHASYHRKQLVASALRELGWERGRYRFHGSLLYAYARGTQLEREAMLDVERGDDDRLVVKRREP